MEGGKIEADIADILQCQRRVEEQLQDLKELLLTRLAANNLPRSRLGRGLSCREDINLPRPLASDQSLVQERLMGHVSDNPPGDGEGGVEAIRSDRLVSTNTVMRDVAARYIDVDTGKSMAKLVQSSACLRAKRIVRDRKFDFVMGVLIIANTITLGVEIQLSLGDHSSTFLTVLEYSFLLCFIAELFLKLMADGLRNFKRAWFLLDFVLAVSGMAGAILVTFSASLEGGGSLIGFIATFQLLRILRLLRLLRTLRSIEQLNEVWKITIGLIRCFKTVMSAMVLVFVTIYFFSCLGVELIFKSSVLQTDPKTSPIVNEYFSSLPMTMLTLVAFANADSIAGIYVPLCSAQPLLCFYFFALWLILTISLMNLVAAVIVENAISSANEDALLQQRCMRKRLAGLVPMIRQVFRELDHDEQGTLSLQEFSFKHLNLPDELRPIIQSDKLIDLFAQLDADDSGEIDEREFVDGVCHLALSGVPVESAQIIQLLRRQGQQINFLTQQHLTEKNASSWDAPFVMDERLALVQ